MHSCKKANTWFLDAIILCVEQLYFEAPKSNFLQFADTRMHQNGTIDECAVREIPITRHKRWLHNADHRTASAPIACNTQTKNTSDYTTADCCKATRVQRRIVCKQRASLFGNCGISSLSMEALAQAHSHTERLFLSIFFFIRFVEIIADLLTACSPLQCGWHRQPGPKYNSMRWIYGPSAESCAIDG